MIIVLLLLFQSICLYCQRLVLYVHDRWINPKNARLLKEAAEEATRTGKPVAPLQLGIRENSQRTKKRPEITTEFGAETCRFCANTPQGYCRHHFHLQELELQREQQQKRFWISNIAVGDKTLEQRQLRKQNRELKRNLKNRLSAQKSHPTQRPTVAHLNNTHFTNATNVHGGNGGGGCCQNNNNCYNSHQDINIDDDAGYYTTSTASLNTPQTSSAYNNNSAININYISNNNNNNSDSLVSSSSTSFPTTSSETCLRTTLDVQTVPLSFTPVEQSP